ncbi:MAG: hypothetical protein OES38_23120 [Gammaproteobacteria bacterium]|nr:hypothetical protein [Gammaproteobacteria bacterium]
MTTSDKHPKITPFVENISEATAACLVTMVQGNILAITLSHWLIASQTGIIAGALASGILLVWHTSKPWMVATLLGITTAVVDFYVHPGMFGSFMVEAIVTGIGAAVLSYIVSVTVIRVRSRYRASD